MTWSGVVTPKHSFGPEQSARILLLLLLLSISFNGLLHDYCQFDICLFIIAQQPSAEFQISQTLSAHPRRKGKWSLTMSRYSILLPHLQNRTHSQQLERPNPLFLFFFPTILPVIYSNLSTLTNVTETTIYV